MQKTKTDMNRVVIILVLILTMTSGVGYAQQINNKIDYIVFRFEHSLRIPYQNVIIEIIKRQNETAVEVKSRPMNNDKQWEYSKIDKKFTIETKRFNELSNKVIQLKNIDLTKALIDGFDGTECTIEFGTFGSTVAYKFWSPDYDSKERTLTYFLELCKELIIIGKLNPKDIL